MIRATRIGLSMTSPKVRCSLMLVLFQTGLRSEAKTKRRTSVDDTSAKSGAPVEEKKPVEKKKLAASVYSVSS